MDYIKNKNRHFWHIISLPIIFSVFIPVFILDVWVEIYHRTCFVLYGLKYVERKKYVKVDRQRLSYLRWYQKIGCAYCGYANGLAAYWVAVFGETEKYWCGISHKEVEGSHCPGHHCDFAEYGNKKSFIDKYVK